MWPCPERVPLKACKFQTATLIVSRYAGLEVSLQDQESLHEQSQMWLIQGRGARATNNQAYFPPQYMIWDWGVKVYCALSKDRPESRLITLGRPEL